MVKPVLGKGYCSARGGCRTDVKPPEPLFPFNRHARGNAHFYRMLTFNVGIDDRNITAYPLVVSNKDDLG